MKTSSLFICLLTLFAIPSVCVQAQDINTALDITGVTFTPGMWHTNTISSHDGVDAIASGTSIAVQPPGSSNYMVDFALTAQFGGPRMVTWWQSSSVNGLELYAEGGIGFTTSMQTEFGWTKRSVEVTPPFTLRWSRETQTTNPATYTDRFYLDEVTQTPLAAVSVEEALDSTGWTLSGPGAMLGVQSTKASDGADYLYMAPGAPGAEAWVERTFTGPVRVSCRWHRGDDSSAVRLLLNGALAETAGPSPVWSQIDTSWATLTKDLGPGVHTLRWVAKASASGFSSAAIDAVTTGPVPGISDVLGTPGRLWVPGGSPPPEAKSTADPTAPSYVEFAPAAGQESWLETSVTGPAIARFEVDRAESVPPADYNPRVTLAGFSVPLKTASLSYRHNVLSIPAGTHTLRFSFPHGGTLDSVSIEPVAAAPNMWLGAPAYPLLEGLYGNSPSRLAAAAGGGLRILPHPTQGTGFGVTAGEMDEPSLFSLNVADYTLEYPIQLYWEGWQKPLNTPTPVVLAGGGPQTLTFSSGYYANVLSNLQRIVLPRTGLNEGLDTTLPLTISGTGKVLGTGGAGWDNTDCVWLQSSAAAEPAWLDIPVPVPATVNMRFRGKGSVYLNGVLTTLPGQAVTGGWTAVTWLTNEPTTIRWQTDPADRSGLFIDALTFVEYTSLEAALELPGFTTGGARPWAYAFNAATGDYAAPPTLHSGEESWVENTITGPFEFEWTAGSPGDSLRLEINGEVRADTAVGFVSPVRVHVPNNTARRCRWIATRVATAAGPSPAPPSVITVTTGTGTILAQLAQDHAFAMPEAVFAASEMESSGNGPMVKHRPLVGGFNEPNSTTSSGSFSLYCSGQGALAFHADVGVNTPPNMLHPGGSASLLYQNTLVPGNPGGADYLRPNASAGLSFVAWSCTVTDVADTTPGLYSIGLVRIRNIQWLPGNTAWRTWTTARGLTGFAADTATDADRDGLPAGLEYLLGTDPLIANAAPFTLTPSASTPPAGFRLTAPKPAWSVAGSILRLETSADLAAWTTAPPGALVEETAGTLTWEVPASGGGRGFARLAPVIAPD